MGSGRWAKGTANKQLQTGSKFRISLHTENQAKDAREFVGSRDALNRLQLQQALNASSSDLRSLHVACCTLAGQLHSKWHHYSSKWGHHRHQSMRDARSFGTAQTTDNTDNKCNQFRQRGNEANDCPFTEYPLAPASIQSVALWVQITCLMLMLVIEMQKYLEICMERTYRAQGMPRNDTDDALAFNKGQQQQQQQHLHITGCQMELPR